ncbi:MAG: nucleoside-diphosphate kinase [Synergistetes bacterium]|nr:MAG: Nucleoside diphosphate kinase [bacterium 42_11]MBC7331209.1 nucleoside-diphosphate kinase [Synergistota bacterium]MDK2871507.1 nucleoside-diphosphate kinase [bacterium]
MEYTYIVVKPNADERAERIIEELPCKVEKVALHVSLPREFWESFYVVHRGKSFYEELLDFMSSGNTSHFIGYGDGVIKKVRKAIGATDPSKAEPGTIRAKYGRSITENAIHASDSPSSAHFELSVGLTGLLQYGYIDLKRFMELKERFLGGEEVKHA